MAKCGIPKYDELPSAVGWIDVDALRAMIHIQKSKIEKAKKKIEETTRKLDEAVEKNEEKK